MNRTEVKMIAEELANLIRPEIRKMVIDLTTSDMEEMEGYMSISEAAKFMGCSKQSIYNKISDIPHVKIGGLLKFQKSELRKYIHGNGKG